ncbi:extensin-like [Sus scrofa]|uniref:extensin-like n=1 Tax=Sus scrofa TaxID=9823 RepID=UPI0006B14ED1|nr:extensin-like [Sus scrofa]
MTSAKVELATPSGESNIDGTHQNPTDRHGKGAAAEEGCPDSGREDTRTGSRRQKPSPRGAVFKRAVPGEKLEGTGDCSDDSVKTPLSRGRTLHPGGFGTNLSPSSKPHHPRSFPHALPSTPSRSATGPWPGLPPVRAQAPAPRPGPEAAPHLCLGAPVPGQTASRRPLQPALRGHPSPPTTRLLRNPLTPGLSTRLPDLRRSHRAPRRMPAPQPAPHGRTVQSRGRRSQAPTRCPAPAGPSGPDVPSPTEPRL